MASTSRHKPSAVLVCGQAHSILNRRDGLWLKRRRFGSSNLAGFGLWRVAQPQSDSVFLPIAPIGDRVGQLDRGAQLDRQQLCLGGGRCTDDTGAERVRPDVRNPKAGAGRGTGREPLRKRIGRRRVGGDRQGGRRLPVGCDELGLAQREAIGSGDLDLAGDAARREAGADLIVGRGRGAPAACGKHQDDRKQAGRANHNATVSAKAGAREARPDICGGRMAQFPTVKEEKAMPAAAAAQTADIGAVEDRNFPIRDFRLQNGVVMPEVNIAYETYGRLAAGGQNGVLVTHGYTSSHHAAGHNPANGDQPGWWDGLIGPGKAIDTDKLFVVSSNMLGSSFGSTNGASLDPATGQPYGADFPAIAVRDIVAAQKLLLDRLGVRHLVAVAGPSYGGYQAFPMGRRLSRHDGCGRRGGDRTQIGKCRTEPRRSASPARRRPRMEWWPVLRTGGAKTVLTELRVEILKRNGIEAAARRSLSDQGPRARRRSASRRWPGHRMGRELAGDPAPRHGRLRHGQGFLRRSRAKVLYVLCADR